MKRPDEIGRLKLLNRHNRWQCSQLQKRPALSERDAARLEGLNVTYRERERLIECLENERDTTG